MPTGIVPQVILIHDITIFTQISVAFGTKMLISTAVPMRTHIENVKLSVEHRIYCRPVQFILDTSTSYFLTFNWFIDNGIE